MIHDKMVNLLKYIPEGKKEKIKEFLKILSPDMDEKKYEIDNTDIYAKIMSYSTRQKADCAIEAHNKYCDIQFTLAGEERISIYPRENMKLISEDETNDFYIFEEETAQQQVQVDNKAGYFTLIHSGEAHQPQESPDGKCSRVKKGMIKIKESLFHE